MTIWYHFKACRSSTGTAQYTPIFAKYILKICLLYANGMPSIWLTYAQHSNEIYWLFAKDKLRIRPKCFHCMLKICSWYAYTHVKDMPNIFPRSAKDMLKNTYKICHIHSRKLLPIYYSDMTNKCSWYPEDIYSK